jgi:hypothetical protein
VTDAHHECALSGHLGDIWVGGGGPVSAQRAVQDCDGGVPLGIEIGGLALGL